MKDENLNIIGTDPPDYSGAGPPDHSRAGKTKKQLMDELLELRHQIVKLEALETERKRAEEALRETREFLENLINYANAPIIVWDPKETITRFNHAFERLTGYKAEDVISQGLSMLFPESSRDESLSKIERTLSGEYWESIEIPILRKDGEIRVALWNSANIYAEDGTTLLATIAQGIDITERKRAEKALRESEERLRSFMESSPDGFYLLDSELNYVDINDTGLGLFPVGTKKEDIIGKNVVEIAPDIKGTGRYDKYLEVIKTGKPFFIDDIVPHPKFGDVHLALRAFKVGNRLGIITTNITECKQAEEALRESEERYRMLFESSQDGIATANLKGFITDCNRAYANILGYSCEELKEIRYQDLTPTKWHAFNKKMFQKVMERGYSGVFEKEYIRKDGAVFPVALNTWRIDDKDGNSVGVGSVVRDITERKLAEAQRAAALEALRESEEKFRNLVEKSRDAIYIMQGRRYVFVNPRFEEMLGYSFEGLSAEGFDLNNLVAPQSRDLIQERAEKIEGGEEVPSSYEFVALSRDGREIEVEVSVTPIDYGSSPAVQGILRDITEKKQLEKETLRAERLGAITEMAITANHEINNPLAAIVGYAELILLREKGLTPSAVKGLKSILKSTDRIRGVTRRLEMMIEPETVEYVKGGRRMLDLWKSKTEADLKIGPYGKRVLVVDEEQAMRDILARMVLSFGHLAEKASGGEEALKMLEKWKFDLVIADMNMPKMGGVELMKVIKERYPDIPVILITGYYEREGRQLDKEKIADGFLAKPFRMKEVKKIVEKVL